MIKTGLFTFLLSIATISFVQSQSATMETRLADMLLDAHEDELLPVMILLADAVDIEVLKSGFVQNNTPVNRRAELVITALQSKASETQPEIINAINISGLVYQELQAFWISNSIVLEANPELINLLANHPAVAHIGLNLPQFGLNKPAQGTGGAAKSEGGIEPGHVVIGAPEMWAMGYTGKGRVAMTFDTGVQPEHPAIGNRFLPNRMPLASTWFGFDSPVPTDKSSSHGTHVSGIMMGLDSITADTIGVAPQAYLIATDPIVSNIADVKPLSELMLGYEWAMNPDGDVTTSDDIPDVINNSWGRPNDIEDTDWGVCSEFVIPIFDALLAAGIANVCSAGNEGPDDMSIGVPHNINTGLVNSFTVGAVSGFGTGPQWNIASFSSRGPSVCGGEGSLLIKPEVSAPGVNVRSSVGIDGYDFFSGTSMAAPHVSGAVLLLKEAFPFLTGEDLMLALYYSAVDQGAPGEDNVFGMGVINVKNAFDYLSETYDPVAPATTFPDIELVSIDEPSDFIACDPDLYNITPLVTIANNGTTEVVGVTFRYKINGGSESVYSEPNLIIGAGEQVQITLGNIFSEGVGSRELHVRIDPIENEVDGWNNNMVYRWTQLPQHILLQEVFTESFEIGIDSDVWTILNPDGSTTWDSAFVIQSDGTEGYAAWMNFHSYNPIASQKDDLITPWMTSSFAFDSYTTGAELSFDYFYRKRNSSTFSQDTLAIHVHQPCGVADPIEIFRKGGSELWTVEPTLTNAFPEDADQWQHVELTIPVAVLEGDEAFYVRFEAINRRANNLLIDNVNLIWPALVSTRSPDRVNVRIHPNPTRDNFTVEWSGNNPSASIDIHDIQGKHISSFTAISQGQQIAIQGLNPGIFLVKVRFEDGTQSVEKLVIQ